MTARCLNIKSDNWLSFFRQPSQADTTTEWEVEDRGFSEDLKEFFKQFYKNKFAISEEIAEEKIIEREFQELANKWRKETSHISSISSKAMNPNYQEIIAYGPDMIPFILRELQKEPDDWFWALYFLSGKQNPIKEEDEGKLDKMAEAWIQWGKDNRYI